MGEVAEAGMLNNEPRADTADFTVGIVGVGADRSGGRSTLDQ
jgi:hypothetical protein